MKYIVPFLILPILFLAGGCEKDPVNKVPTAEAGSSLVTQLPVDSVLLTGIGTDADGKVVSYLWSQVNGPASAIIVNPGSSSTRVRSLKEGVYLFQLMVVDDMGATGVDTVSVQVTASPIQLLSLQPAQNPTEVHIWGNNSNLEGSFNGAVELGAAAWTYNGANVGQRGLFKFDLSSIPANATILSAKLSLYSNPTPLNGDLVNANSGPDNSILIQRVVGSWTSSAVKWASQPATTTQGQIVIPHTNSSFLDLIDVDVKNLVQSMVSTANYGFMIRLQNETFYNSRLFASSFHSNSTKHPKLTIEYSK